MAEKKKTQLTLAEYQKIKKSVEKKKLKLNFPWFLKLCFALPLVYVLFLLIYYLAYVRFVAIH
jgi:hypothetical protein